MSCISVSNDYIAVGGRDGLLTVYDIKSYNKLLTREASLVWTLYRIFITWGSKTSFSLLGIRKAN